MIDNTIVKNNPGSRSSENFQNFNEITDIFQYSDSISVAFLEALEGYGIDKITY